MRENLEYFEQSPGSRYFPSLVGNAERTKNKVITDGFTFEQFKIKNAL